MSRNEEDFGFLDDLLTGSESDLQRENNKDNKKKDTSPSNNEGRSNDMHDSLFDEMANEFVEQEVESEVERLTIKEDVKHKSIQMPDIDKKENVKMPDIDKKEEAIVNEEIQNVDNKEGGESSKETFVAVYDDDDDEDKDNDYHNDDTDEYEGLPPEIRAALDWKPPPPKSTPEILINEWTETGWVGDLHIDQILTDAILTGASDVHITADLRVSMTRNGDIVRCDGYAIPDEQTMHEVVHNGILTHQQQSVFNRDYEFEGSYTLRYGPLAGRRTRLTIGKTFGKYFMVFRIISEYIPSLEELSIEDELVRWSHYPNGLILICGPTGSGKTTTLASILHNLQMTTKKKIISIEKPIEYIYPDDTPSLVVQRDVGEDTRGFYEGLTSAMRQSPNVILLGEVRNTEEVTELLRAAETGHLAISTMHTNSVATTINRIQNLFEGNEQRRVMSTLADTMRGVGNQVLVKTKDGEGRFAVRELLTVNEEVKQMIVKGDVRAIRQYQIENKSTMEHKLAEAYKEGKCHYEDALSQTSDPDLFNKLVKED